MIKTIITFVDKMMPGHKTYAIMLIGIAMMVCQMMVVSRDIGSLMRSVYLLCLERWLR